MKAAIDLCNKQSKRGCKDFYVLYNHQNLRQTGEKYDFKTEAEAQNLTLVGIRKCDILDPDLETTAWSQWTAGEETSREQKATITTNLTVHTGSIQTFPLCV